MKDWHHVRFDQIVVGDLIEAKSGKICRVQSIGHSDKYNGGVVIELEKDSPLTGPTWTQTQVYR
jgi:hypothetical protein